MRTKMIAAVLVVLIISASIVFGAVARRGAGPGHHGCGFLRGLNLTQDQIAQIKVLRTQFQTATQTTRTDLKARVLEMIQLWSANPPDPVAIKAKAAEIETLKATIKDARIDFMISVYSLLTPAQKAQVQTKLQTLTTKIQEGKGMDWGMGVCPGGMGGGPRAHRMRGSYLIEESGLLWMMPRLL